MSGTQQILERLPHREPFRFITELIDFQAGVSGTARWVVHGHESFFAGHLPGQPIIPGVLLAESLAQLAGLVGWCDQAGDASDVRLAHVDLKFGAAVIPPAEVLLGVQVIRTMGSLRLFSATARVAEVNAASGMLTLAAMPRREDEVTT